MALRPAGELKSSTRSATVGDTVEFRVKIENTTATPANVTLSIEDLHEGAMRKPLDHPMRIEPASLPVPGKSRKAVAFTWTASLPAGKDAFTFRGRVVLRDGDGAVIIEAPLDLYVGQA